jgi:hypothetical protein
MRLLKRQIYAIILLFIIIYSCGQNTKTDFILAFSDSSSGERLWGFKTTSGHIIIEPKYNRIYGSDTLHDIAFVQLNYKWIAIDKNDSVILTPFICDNGPDDIEEGLFRFVENDKMGFANSKGQKIIPAQFDFAFPFYGGLAGFSVGGKSEKFDEDHSIWNGGFWGFINHNGQVVIEPQFLKIRAYDSGTCEVWTKDNKFILIDKTGRTIEELPN